MEKIFVTGYGVVSAAGLNATELLANLSAEKSGIEKRADNIINKYFLGQIRMTNEELAANYSLNHCGSRTAMLGAIAVKQAFEGHQFEPTIRTGLISGTSVGGMDMSEDLYANQLNGESVDLELYVHHSSGNTTVEIAKELGFDGFQNTISTACSSAANAIMMGARMIRNGLLDRVIVGGTDALSKFTINGFRSLMIFDEEWCKPFDENRKGLNLGEGAGYLVIESEQSIQKSGKQPIVELAGWSNASDAHHQTASSPDGYGAQLSMTEAMKIANVQPSDIGYINAHGTATPNNDLSESQSIKSIFKDAIPPFSSTKPYTGHTLAACGGIEAVISIFAITEGILPPNLNFTNKIEETQLIPQLKFESGKKINAVLSNSFGFGGNNSTLIFKSI